MTSTFATIAMKENTQPRPPFFKKLILAFSVVPLAIILPAYGSQYNSFDDIPATKAMEIPENGGGWNYSSTVTNPQVGVNSCRWYDTKSYPDHPGIFDSITWYVNSYNSDHMGWTTHGFLEIDDTTAIRGHSLRLVTTGGTNSNGSQGVPLFNKESYLQALTSGDPASHTTVGHPTLYFMNNSMSHAKVPIYQAKNTNRLSLYFKLPPNVTNGIGGYGNPVTATTSLGPFNDVGGHWYHSTYNRGGGWTHVLVDGHPQHNNGWHNSSLYPYPSSSLRDYDVAYFNTLHTWYFTFLPYQGIAQTPYDIWLDEITFYHDPEPQNNETISTPAITYHPTTHNFEISFSDKYKGNANSYSTYEVRYSFSQITNSNWAQATPVTIQTDERFRINNRTDGKFQKWWPYYQAVWAPFTLKEADESRLTSGSRIYFAIKDISQTTGDTHVPVDGLNGDRGPRKGGRAYDTAPETFDYAGDSAVLNYIKRIDFLIPQPGQFVPDLSALSMVPGKLKLTPKEQTILSMKIKNEGNTTAADSTLRYYLSNDPQISTTDTAIATQPLSSLRADKSSTNTIMFQAPNIVGNYWLGGCIDSVNQETDITNNCTIGIKISVVTSHFSWNLFNPAAHEQCEVF